ncbi:ABC transporter permease [Streptomyces sp. A3M-1-3]|uniref:ABC transporter permease n=1 Tax=Streptomyces sp. A3M-1-3 TaxID=2962044 RepID=UPI0020B6A16D|nr:ABC transporter permease [Streptomyces sp. A3M-1-3]MCP3818176.1 ABC transporter permease [Streptomyces sp. A3M-1-3]
MGTPTLAAGSHRVRPLSGTGRYVLRKLTWAAGTVFFVLCFNFALFRLLPGDPIGLYTRGRNMPAEQIAAMRAKLDQPIGQQFVDYLANPFSSAVQSVSQNAPVWQVIGERVWPTVLLVGTSILLASVFGIRIGIRAGWQRGSRFDRISTGSTLALYAMPEFWIGMVLMIALPMFPSAGINSDGVDPSSPAGWLDTLWHMTLPVASLTLVYLAEYAAIMRASLVDELGQDYLTLARATGLREALVRRKHAVPNALLPTMTLIFLNFGFVIGGAITVEAVFSWPGLGQLSYDALRGPDIPLLQAVFLLFSLSVIVFTLLADLLYVVLDPRVSDA